MFALTCPAMAQTPGNYNAIYSGVPWFDDHGHIVSAHGANIIKDKGRFYLFGEKHTDNNNAFAGFNCYSSADLCNWKFERIALPTQADGKLGPNRVGERPKVLKCPKTGEYIMLMHTDDMAYKDQCIGYATAKNVAGPYVFKGALLFNGKPIKKWDMGSFQDSDGSGYLLLHGGDIYKLADDYHSAAAEVVKNIWPECESPAVFKKAGVYFWLGSHRTSWERNDNLYYTATSLQGPWTAGGMFAPELTLTWNSQTTFVLPIAGAKDTTFMFMGDRWSFPLQASAATYVWQPLKVAGTSLSMPTFLDAWQVNSATGIASAASVVTKTIGVSSRQVISYNGEWSRVTQDNLSISSSDNKGASYSVKFSGKQIGFYSGTDVSGGYGQVTIRNGQGKIVVSAVVDMYSLYPMHVLKFLSPFMAEGNYTLTLTVMGQHSSWTDKKRSDYGSRGNAVYVSNIVVN